MEVASRVGQRSKRSRERHTVVVREPVFAQRQRRISPGSAVSRRLRVARARVMQPRVLIVLAVLAISSFSIAAYYYNSLAREIDERLKGNHFDNSVGIFTSPFKVSVGDRLTLAELSEYLRQAGYSEKQSLDQEQAAGTFAAHADSIVVMPGRAASAQLRLSPVRIQVNGAGRVTSLTIPESGKSVSSASIEGELLASVRNGDRRKKTLIHFTDVPAGLRNAIVAVEDRRFFSHSGIDWRGIARALWADLNSGEIIQGGSTLTQQLVKNAFLNNDRTFGRKIKEAALAVILESRLSKQEIFALYCNEAYLGHSGTFAIHGFAEAARVCFGKDLPELTLAESAFLAGSLHAPNRYSALREQERAIERRNLVLDAMVATGSLASDEAEAAKREPLKLKKNETRNDFGATYFIDYAQRFVESRYGSRASTQQSVYTTMDPRLQRAAYDAVTEHAENLDKIFARSARKGSEPQQVQAALVALDAHTGEVLAMIGGRSYDESQLNRATDAKRQPGSTFKPFVYASALGMRSYTAATLISDRPQSFSYDGGRREYKPANYHGAFTNRDVTLREAFMKSLNVPAVELAMRVGLGNVAELAEEAGLERPRAYPSMALGTSEVTPLQIAGAYTAFANGGNALKPLPVRSVGSGAVSDNLSAAGVRVFSPQVAYLLTNLMQSVVDSGTAAKVRALGVKGAVAGKTGTSNDGWFVGYTPNLVCAVWVGFDDNTDTRMKASETALPIWAEFVKRAIEIRPQLGGESFARPGGIVTVDIDPATGYIATEGCTEHRQEIFISGTEPFATCMHETLSDSELVAGLEGYPLPVAGEPDGDYDRITLDVCAETGLLSSSGCRRVQKKTFTLGKEPLDICRTELHSKASNVPSLEMVTVTPVDMSDAAKGTRKRTVQPPPSP